MRQEPDPDPSQRPGEIGGRDSRPDVRLGGGLEGLFQDAQPPEALRASLRAEAERRFGVPEPVGADPSPRRPFTLLRGTAWASGLAAAAAGLFLLLKVPSSRAEPQGHALAIAEPEGEPLGDHRDIDRSGRVDIFDAYLVAKAASGGRPTAGMPDLDGDGRVTRADADRIARFAVEVVR